MNTTPNMPGWQAPTFNLPTLTQGVKVPSASNGWSFKNYLNKWGGQNYNLLNAGISASNDLAGNLINSNGFSTTAGNLMSGIGNIVGNIPGPIGWAGKGLALAGQAVNALWGHKFNDANVAAAESANIERNNFQFGDYSNTDALLAGSMANVQLGNVSKGFLGKEGPFSNAVTNKMKQINNDRMMANLRANNSELNAYNNYQMGSVRNAIAGDSMGSVNAAAYGGLLNTFANGGHTHGSLFNNGFIEVNNGGSHEQNPNQGVQYGIDPYGTPNMVEEGETIFDDYVFSKRIKFPKKYKDEFALGGKIWKKSFADISKMIAKESEERPNDPISQRSLEAMGGKLADIQEEVKAKQALDKMDPREVMAMLQQLQMMQQGGEQPQMEEQQMMEDPYQQQMMEEQPMIAACGGKLHSYGGNLFKEGGWTNPYVARRDSSAPYEQAAINRMLLHFPTQEGSERINSAQRVNVQRNNTALQKQHSTGKKETKAERKHRQRQNQENLDKAKKEQKFINNLRKQYVPKATISQRGTSNIYSTDNVNRAKMQSNHLNTSFQTIGQDWGNRLNPYTHQDLINNAYYSQNMSNLTGAANGAMFIADPISSLNGLVGGYFGSELGKAIAPESKYAPVIGGLVGGVASGGLSRLGKPNKVFISEEQAAKNVATRQNIFKQQGKEGLDFYNTGEDNPYLMYTTSGWHNDPTTASPVLRYGSWTLPISLGVGIPLITSGAKSAYNDITNDGFDRKQNNEYADGGYIDNPNIQLFDNVNLFKNGSEAKIKGKSGAHKSDSDWERMYDMALPVYQKMVNAGVPEWLARGVIANIATESSFNPNATNGTHWGYVQNDKSLRSYIEKMYKGYNADQQLQFLIDGLTTGIKGADKGTGKQIQKRFDNYKKAMEGVTDPETAAELWEKHYEISGGQGMYDRKNYARKFYDKRNPQVAQAVEQTTPATNSEVVNSPYSVNNFTPTGDFATPNSAVVGNLLASVDAAAAADTPYSYAVNAEGQNVTPNYTPVNNKKTWNDFKDINGNLLYDVENKKYADIYTDPKFLEWAWDNPDNDYLNNQSNFVNWYKQHKEAPTNKDIFGARGKTGTTTKRGKFIAAKGFDKQLGDAHFYIQHMINKYLALQDPQAAKKLEEQQQTKEKNPVNQDPVRTLAEQQAANKLLRQEREKYKEGPTKYIIRSVDANGTPIDREIEYNADTFATQFPGYKYNKEDDREYDDENKTFSRKFIYTKQPEVKEDNRPTWMRYLPPAALGVMTLTDSLGITNKLDNSIANQLYASSSNAGQYTPVRSTPLPNPYVWTPQNRNYIFGDINNTEAGAARTAANLYGNNIGALVGNLAAISANANKARGESYAAINENDMKNFKEIAGLRLGIGQNNAKNSLDAQVANQGAFANALKSRNDALIKGAEYAYKAKHDRDENISSNMSEFLQSLADIGTENMNWNWRNWAIRSGAFGPMKSMPSSDIWG